MSNCSSHRILSMLSLVFLFFVQTTAEAKSVYVVNHQWKRLLAYRIDEDKIEWQAKVKIPEHGLGPIDVAIDDEAEIIFISFEQKPFPDLTGGNIIEMYNTSLCHIGTVKLTGPQDIAGLVFDKVNSRLIAGERSDNRIWLIDWDGQTLTLDTEPSSVNLSEMELHGAAGLALNDNILCVSAYNYPSGYTKSVHLYDMDDNWRHIDPIGMGNKVVGIAYSSKDEVIYGGAYDFEGSYHHLIKRSIDPNTTIEKDVGAGVIGISIDDDTGLVYITAYRDAGFPTGGSVEVYDTSSWTGSPTSVDPKYIYDNDNNDNVVVSGVAGLAVGPDFVPPFDPNVTDDIEDCVSPCDGQITYTITLSGEWAEEWIAKLSGFDKIKIVDELPEELDFVEELNDPNWQYSASSRTATWWIHDPNFWDWSDSITLTLKVNRKVAPGGIIKNEFKAVLVYSGHEDEIRIAMIETEVCDCSDIECGQTIYVDISAEEGNNNGSTWLDAYTSLQSGLAKSWPCDQIWVAEGTYKPTTNPSLTGAKFRMVSGVGVYGGFLGGMDGETERYERNWFDNKTILSGDINGSVKVDHVVVSDANAPVSALDGFTIKSGGTSGVYCEDSSPIIQHNKITNNAIGVYCFESVQPVAKNNWIYRNDCGMYFDEPGDAPIVRNNTIAYNTDYGVWASDIDPNISITNCILWGNAAQLNLDFVPTYSCIQNWTQGGTGNISTDPSFVDPNQVDPVDDNYLLKADSRVSTKAIPTANMAGKETSTSTFEFLMVTALTAKEWIWERTNIVTRVRKTQRTSTPMVLSIRTT